MRRSPLVIAIVIFAAAWLLVVCFFWINQLGGYGFSGSGIMLYAIVSYFIALPLAALASSVIVGRARGIGGKRFAVPVAVTILYELAQLVTAGVLNGLDGAHLVNPLAAVVFGLIPSAIGIAIGAISIAAR